MQTRYFALDGLLKGSKVLKSRSVPEIAAKIQRLIQTMLAGPSLEAHAAAESVVPEPSKAAAAVAHQVSFVGLVVVVVVVAAAAVGTQIECCPDKAPSVGEGNAGPCWVSVVVWGSVEITWIYELAGLE
jgi:hypothetical protein